MDKKKFLKADIAGAISDLQASMKEFLLKKRLYRLLLRGKGLEFESYRTYAPDDDAGSIDWKASKRANSLLIKQYRDERNLKVVFLVDVGENMVFGSVDKLKCEYTAEVVAAFSHLITTTGDKPGFIFFSDEVKDYLKPSRGKKHFNQFMDHITSPQAYGGFSDLDKGLEFALNYVSRDVESLIIVSDFLSFTEETKINFSLIANKFETTALMIRDPLDNTLPDISGEIVVEDPLSGQQLLVNPRVAKEAYENYSHAQQELIRKACLTNNIDLLEISTDKPFVPTLSSFLKGRVKQKVRISK
jgi:uncharacterized protein (DUF58 family)